MGLNAKGDHVMDAASEPDILTSEGGIKLQAEIALTGDNAPLVILIHGWEGSANSSYVLHAARQLWDMGVSTARLNLRDHGGTHHLNEGLFYATHLDEVFDAVSQLCARFEDRPAFLTGFSLGGNFVLRVVAGFGAAVPENLKAAFSISPVLEPLPSTQAIVGQGLIERYFIKKWRASLERKQSLYPDTYDFEAVLEQKDLWDMTMQILTDYGDGISAEDYFNGYSIRADTLGKIQLPTHVIMSKDDPVIPFDHFDRLHGLDNIRLHALPHGGHNGFFQRLRGPTWHDLFIQTKIRPFLPSKV